MSGVSMWALAAASVILGASGAHAQTPPLVPHPKWDATPTPDALQRYYPQKAHDQGVEGDARLRCLILADGGLTGCTIDHEDPSGDGFGEAALKLAPLYRARSHAGSGPVGTAVIPIYFRIPNVARPGDGALSMALVEWDVRPTTAQVEAAAPKGAGSGRVNLLCQVGEGGFMKVCRVIGEMPAGKGFGDAALSLTSAFRAAPVTSQGVPMDGGSVTLSLAFGKQPPPIVLPPAPTQLHIAPPPPQ